MKPHDPTDLRLAPVALEVDERLRELGSLTREELDFRVAVESGADTHTTEMRQRGLLVSVTHLIDLHGWDASWDERGLMLSHSDHRLTLGLPPSLRQYVDG